MDTSSDSWNSPQWAPLSDGYHAQSAIEISHVDDMLDTFMDDAESTNNSTLNEPVEDTDPGISSSTMATSTQVMSTSIIEHWSPVETQTELGDAGPLWDSTNGSPLTGDWSSFSNPPEASPIPPPAPPSAPPNPASAGPNNTTTQVWTFSPNGTGTMSTYTSAHQIAMATPASMPFEQALSALSSNLQQIAGSVSQGFAPAIFHLDHNVEDYDDDLPTVTGSHRGPDFNAFLQQWRREMVFKPHLHHIGREASRIVSETKRPRTYRKSDLENGQDVQGIDWRKLETTRSKARSVRSQLYCQFEPIHNATKTTNCDDYFRFTRVNNEHRAYITHFQLRNLIAATSRNDIYYANKYKIMHTDLSDQVNECAIDLTKTSTDSWDNSGGFVTTTLTATEEALIGGSFFGEYVVKSLKSDYDEPPTIGAVTQETNGITNHVHAFNSRTNGQRQAAFCNNDQHLRLLDLTTNSFTGDFTYPAAINCAATSPNGQMRIVVGDFLETLITNAQTGKPFESLLAHTDHVFACAWADDGIHIATGAQDCRIAIHDARWWARPVAVISSEMACPRSLSFSPVGSGKRLLLAAEADDFVHVIDAVGFTKKQTVDFFGPIGGACWTGDGGEFVVSNSDARLGGLMGFERRTGGERYGAPWYDESLQRRHDWVDDMDLDDDPRVSRNYYQRARSGLGLLGELVV